MDALRRAPAWCAGVVAWSLMVSTACASQPMQQPDVDADTPSCAKTSLMISRASSSDDIACAIRRNISNIRSLRYGASKQIDAYRTKQTAFDSSLIGLGIGSVAAAMYRSSVEALGGIGIVASGVSQYRSYYNPEKVGADYITAVKGARCVASTAEPLLTVDAAGLLSTIQRLRQAIADAELASTKLTAASAAGKADALDASARAVEAANTALVALQAEASAYISSPAVIDQAHDAIKNFIDQARHRTSVDYSTVQEALNNGILAASRSAADTQTARSQLFDAVKAQAKAQQTTGASLEAPAPTIGVTPDSLAATDRALVGNLVAPGAPVANNMAAVSALIAATHDALRRMPSPQITTINTQITACTAALSS